MKEIQAKDISFSEYLSYQRHVEKFHDQYFDSSYRLLDNGLFIMKTFDRPMRKKKVKKVEADKENVKKTFMEQLAWTKKNRQRSMRQFVDLLRHNADKLVSFGTLTFDPEKVGHDLSREQALKYWDNFANRVRKEYPDIAFVKVDEKHKNGRTHFHFVSSAPVGHELFPIREPKKLWNSKKQRYYELYCYDIPFWNYGFSDIKDLRLETGIVDENFDIGLYMAKYMAKTFASDFESTISRLHEKKYTVINGSLLDRPKSINFNREYDDLDLLILKWLKKKGYKVNQKYVAPKNFDGTMAPSYMNYEIKIKREHVHELKMYLEYWQARPVAKRKIRERNTLKFRDNNHKKIEFILPVAEMI